MHQTTDTQTARPRYKCSSNSLHASYVNHVLHQLMPAQRNTGYDLRSRHHDRSLTQKTTSIVESDYIIRMLFKDSY